VPCGDFVRALERDKFNRLIPLLGKTILKPTGKMSRLSFFQANIVSLDEYEKKISLLHANNILKKVSRSTFTSKRQCALLLHFTKKTYMCILRL
tara:strand:+ start:13 stop:294 length:282 start_codon:yes stop_codon:yes gene_type:complete